MRIIWHDHYRYASHASQRCCDPLTGKLVRDWLSVLWCLLEKLSYIPTESPRIILPCYAEYY